MNQKILLRVSTPHQYCFVEKEVDGRPDGVFIRTEYEVNKSIKEEYDGLYALMNPATSEGTEALLRDLISIVKANLVMKDIERYEAFSPLKKELLKEMKNLVVRVTDKYKK